MGEQGCHLQVSLLPHQTHGVCWMYQMENLDTHHLDTTNDNVGDNNTHTNNHNNNNNNVSLGLNGLLWERRQFREGDVYYYSPALGQARLHLTSGTTTSNDRGGGGRRKQQQRRHTRINRGGILADEMGMGKTVQAVALIVATLDELRNQQHTNSATLIIVPPALIGQWMNEIKKIAGDNLVVQFLDHKEQQPKTKKKKKKPPRTKTQQKQ